MVTASKIDPKSPVFVPRYSYAEAERLAGVSRGTAKRWLRGYRYRGPDGEPRFRAAVIPGDRRNDAEAYVSFADLVEIAAVQHFRRGRWSLGTIRTLIKECQAISGVDRPLITQRFQAQAQDTLVERNGSLAGLTGKKRLRAWYTLHTFLDTLEYEGDFVSRWWPLGADVPVMVDPAFGFGLPVIANTGLRTEIVLEQMQVGETETAIAKDYHLPVESVAAAIQFELSRLPETA